MDDNQRNNPGPLRRLPDCSPFSRHYQELEGEPNRDEVLMRIRPLGGELRLDSIDPLAEVDAEDEIARSDDSLSAGNGVLDHWLPEALRRAATFMV